jgi:hypothetical protein
MLNELKTIQKFVGQIEILNKRSMLLERVLNCYNKKTMTFDIPATWKDIRIRKDKLSAKSPIHFINDQIREPLTNDELCIFENMP